MLSEAEFYSKVCRICGSKNSICTDLFHSTRGNYLQKVQKLIPIKIQSDDKLPKKICHVCIAIINDFYSLTENCLKAQISLAAAAQNYHPSDVSEKSNEIDRDVVNENNNHANTETRNEEETNPDETVECSTESCLTDIDKDEASSSNTSLSKNQNDGDEISEVIKDIVIEDQKQTPDKEKAKKKENNWTLQRLPNGTILCLCNICNMIMTSEEGMKNHHCESVNTSNKFEKRTKINDYSKKRKIDF